MKPVRKRVLLIAGGTGGHTLPCLALQKYLEKKRVFHRVVTSNTDDFKAKGTLHLPVLPKKKHGIAFVKELLAHVKAYRDFIKKNAPTHIILFGSVYCFPALIAYTLHRISGKKCRLILHEQNALLGRMHRISQFFAHSIALSFQKTQGISPLARHKTHYVGTPIRSQFYGRKSEKTPKKHKSLLIVGGSQGANFFASQIFLKFLYSLDAHNYLTVYHQTPAPFVSSVRHFYRKLGVNAQVSTFFANMDEILPKVDGIISRAGGSTLAEIIACKIPSILIPYPLATDKHQKKNALFLAKKGAALFLQQNAVTPQVLGALVQKLLHDKNLRTNMCKSMAKIHCKNPCEKIHEILKRS